MCGQCFEHVINYYDSISVSLHVWKESFGRKIMVIILISFLHFSIYLEENTYYSILSSLSQLCPSTITSKYKTQEHNLFSHFHCDPKISSPFPFHQYTADSYYFINIQNHDLININNIIYIYIYIYICVCVFICQWLFKINKQL